MTFGQEPVQQFIDDCDRLIWQTPPFGTPIVVPTVPDEKQVANEENPQPAARNPLLVTNSLRQHLAMRLVQARLYEEADKVLQGLNENGSADAAGLFILKGVTAFHLGHTEQIAENVQKFQQLAKESEKSPPPRRYLEIAKMLQYAAEQQSNETEQIAKQMNDVRRKLGKGKTDDDTQKSEDGILKSLDKLIEKVEKKAQQAGGNPKGGQGNEPAKDSYKLGQKAPGKVDRRDFAPDADWGSVDPKERDEALQKIEKDFPPFYRDIIEQYFRELAQ
jgi:hypothetical protein